MLGAQMWFDQRSSDRHHRPAACCESASANGGISVSAAAGAAQASSRCWRHSRRNVVTALVVSTITRGGKECRSRQNSHCRSRYTCRWSRRRLAEGTSAHHSLHVDEAPLAALARVDRRSRHVRSGSRTRGARRSELSRGGNQVSFSTGCHCRSPVRAKVELALPLTGRRRLTTRCMSTTCRSTALARVDRRSRHVRRDGRSGSARRFDHNS